MITKKEIEELDFKEFKYNEEMAFFNKEKNLVLKKLLGYNLWKLEPLNHEKALENYKLTIDDIILEYYFGKLESKKDLESLLNVLQLTDN